jgi:DNA-binding PadR family transcriptional regulator
MSWITYTVPSAVGPDREVRVRLSRGRRRVLLALLSGADNLHSRRLREIAQVLDASLHPFLDRLTEAGWVDGHIRTVAGRRVRCYHLTTVGRIQAAGELVLIVPSQLDPRP